MKLSSSIRTLPLVGPIYLRRLEKLEISTIEDLLMHVPNRFDDFRVTSPISKVQPGEVVTIKGKVESIKNIYTHRGKIIQKAEVSDSTGKIQISWFNQPFITRTIHKGETFAFSGKADLFDRKITLVSPAYESMEDKQDGIHTGRLVPIYPGTSGISSKWLRGRVNYLLNRLLAINDFLPEKIYKNFGMPNLFQAFTKAHFPENLEDAQRGKRRLAFNELLFYQLKSLYRKNEWSKNKVAHKLLLDKKVYEEFLHTLSFDLTRSQIKAVSEIFEDLKKEIPMNRLLEGDVGSGKTVVAAAASFVSFVNGFQTVLMAPTQILAQQHYETLHKIFDKFKVRVSLITSDKVKADLGKTDIFVGTHALIHKKVKFDNVSLVIIDEQHRFGVEQRAHLVKKSGRGNRAPHILTMTATPIPRTVALTVYGDLDLSTLDELPKGRLPITTWVVPPQKRVGAYNWIREQITKYSVQAFIVCPLIEESQVETMKEVKAVTVEFEKLKKIFSGLNLGLLHGRQTLKVKNDVLEDFREKKTQILVATPVVEVGIDVANATIMIIEGAERFGLAQLHQLRGRVGRGETKSYCLLFTESHSSTVRTRLVALKGSMSGFELAELDLKMRGPGEFLGTKQHGFPELKIALWTDTELIKKSRAVAQEALDHPEKFPKLIEIIESKSIVPN